LIEFLINRGVNNDILGNYLHWYLMVECQDKKYGRMYAKVAFQFLSTLVKVIFSNETDEGVILRDNLRRQGELIASLANLGQEFRASKESRPKKIEKLREYIADPKNNLITFPPTSLPLDPTVQVTGIIAEKASMFKSALLPFFLTFITTENTEYQVIFKTGDDLRQDQLVVQIISLMDRLLLKENLDLHLTPYKVLATGIDHGMLQFVHSSAIASILSENNNSLIPYLASSTTENTFQIEKKVMDRYIRSNGTIN
jgi:phosphatidylinositol 3-kinase